MNDYMINIDLPKILTPHFIALIPEQRDLVNKLMLEKVITSYSLTADRAKLWITLTSASEEQVIQLMNTFPLIEYMKYKIQPLALHNSISYSLPQFSLN